MTTVGRRRGEEERRRPEVSISFEGNSWWNFSSIFWPKDIKFAWLLLAWEREAERDRAVMRTFLEIVSVSSAPDERSLDMLEQITLHPLLPVLLVSVERESSSTDQSPPTDMK
jgi:hypothetical protein